jgi:hypothetical protein
MPLRTLMRMSGSSYVVTFEQRASAEEWCGQKTRRGMEQLWNTCVYVRSEDGSDKFLRNVGNHAEVYTEQ